MELSRSTRTSNKNTPAGGEPVEQYFNSLIQLNGSLYTNFKGGLSNKVTNDTKDLQNVVIKNSIFEQEVFRQLASNLDLININSENNKISLNIPGITSTSGLTNEQRASISKIKVTLGIGSDYDKQVVYNMLVDKNDRPLITILNPNNSNNIRDIDFSKSELKRALLKDLTSDQQDFVTQYEQALSMARAITLMADQHGNVSNATEALAIADGDVELTSDNMKFVGALLSKSGLNNIYNPECIKKWLQDQTAANVTDKVENDTPNPENRIIISETAYNELIKDEHATKTDFAATQTTIGVNQYVKSIPTLNIPELITPPPVSNITKNTP